MFADRSLERHGFVNTVSGIHDGTITKAKYNVVVNTFVGPTQSDSCLQQLMQHTGSTWCTWPTTSSRTAKGRTPSCTERPSPRCFPTRSSWSSEWSGMPHPAPELGSSPVGSNPLSLSLTCRHTGGGLNPHVGTR